MYSHSLQSFKIIEKKIQHLQQEQFAELALELFQLQYKTNPVYRKYVQLIGRSDKNVNVLEEIPFLPISAFKYHKISSSRTPSKIIFESSGTQGLKSKHYIASEAWYKQQSKSIFEAIYGSLNDFCILALLPSYLERNNSSLVYMVDHFMQISQHPENGFYLNDHTALNTKLIKLKSKNQKVLLIGVSFALLDFADKFIVEENPNLIVMETGGMKGKRKEMIRSELHERLKLGFQQENIHSEYGMTELLSQTYSKEEGIFEENRFLKVFIGKHNQPFDLCQEGEVGKVKLIDFSNLHSCAFIETDDLGKKLNERQFEILGRSDLAEQRGCNLMLT